MLKLRNALFCVRYFPVQSLGIQAAIYRCLRGQDTKNDWHYYYIVRKEKHVLTLPYFSPMPLLSEGKCDVRYIFIYEEYCTIIIIFELFKGMLKAHIILVKSLKQLRNKKAVLSWGKIWRAFNILNTIISHFWLCWDLFGKTVGRVVV